MFCNVNLMSTNLVPVASFQFEAQVYTDYNYIMYIFSLYVPHSQLAWFHR